ncbi:MAG: hypothetical protein KDK23_07515, partial [Leptospiraceae bacterium]|nr:hypothetical protein [Leptospiraceae bacterium]
LLRNLWPELLDRWKQKPVMLGLAANETGWKGRLSLLRSTYDPASGMTNLDKAFVMEGSHCLALCAVTSLDSGQAEKENQEESQADAIGADKSPDRIAICRIPLSEVQCTVRDDGESLFEFDGQKFHHYRIRGSLQIEAREAVVLEAGRYRRLAPQFMMREVTGLGAMALGLLQNSSDDKALESELQAYCAEVGLARQQGRPGKKNLKWAAEIIARLCQKKQDIHPLWHRLNATASL